MWRVERATRAKVLIDGAAFFGALRAALLSARRSIFIVGWDIDSRCRLVGEQCTPDDGMPASFVKLVSAIVRERSDLTVRLVLWDYPVLYGLEREPFPTLSLQWNTPPQVQLCLDNTLPLGSSHHQKVIVIDDAVAFSGGLDVTIRRWDTPDHRLDNPDRVDPGGQPYRPFHDVQAMVDGPAARALAELARERWARAGCEPADPVEPAGDPWPKSVVPDFHDIDVGLARTLPVKEGEPEIREVEHLFADSIAAANESIYIENQFLTATAVSEHLARALRANPALEVLLIGPQHYHTWIEASTMGAGRIRFMRRFEEAGVADRVRLLYPEVRDGAQKADTMVHSKVCIVDDWFLRVGSANLNNRSMGTDTECDLAFVARTAEHRARIAGIRNALLGEHCGVAAGEIAKAIAVAGSLTSVAETVSDRGHRLRPVEDGSLEAEELAVTIEQVADPPRPLGVTLIGEDNAWFAKVPASTLAKLALAIVVLLALGLAWSYTPLSALAEPETVRNALRRLVDSAWAPLVVVLVFLAAGLVVFPVVVLIAVTAATFGPVLGFIYAGLGCLASALLTYGIGAWLGKEPLSDLLGPRLDRIRARIVDRGVLAVAAIRLVPLAPYTLVNLVAGASQIRLQDYIAGTVLGLLPGLLVMSALGHQVAQVLERPTAANVAMFGAAILAWIGVSIGVQALVSKLRGT